MKRYGEYRCGVCNETTAIERNLCDMCLEFHKYANDVWLGISKERSLWEQVRGKVVKVLDHASTT